MKNNLSFVVTYTNDIGGVSTPLEAAKECLDGILNQGARTFEVLNNTTGEKVSVDLEEDDEDAVLPLNSTTKAILQEAKDAVEKEEKLHLEMIELLRRVQSDLNSMDSDELSKFEKNLLRDTNKILKKI
jgi:hypothetical protein